MATGEYRRDGAEDNPHRRNSDALRCAACGRQTDARNLDFPSPAEPLSKLLQQTATIEHSLQRGCPLLCTCNPEATLRRLQVHQCRKSTEPVGKTDPPSGVLRGQGLFSLEHSAQACQLVNCRHLAGCGMFMSHLTTVVFCGPADRCGSAGVWQSIVQHFNKNTSCSSLTCSSPGESRHTPTSCPGHFLAEVTRRIVSWDAECMGTGLVNCWLDHDQVGMRRMPCMVTCILPTNWRNRMIGWRGSRQGSSVINTTRGPKVKKAIPPSSSRQK